MQIENCDALISYRVEILIVYIDVKNFKMQTEFVNI